MIAANAPAHRAAGAVAAFARRIDRLAIVGGYLAAICLAALVVLISAQIVVAAASRVFPALPGGISIAWEYSAYLMGAAFLLGSGVTLRAGGHIRLGTVVDRLGPAGQLGAEIIASAIGSLFAGFLFWSLLQLAVQSWLHGYLSAESFTPLWIPQGALAAGALLLALQMIARLLNVLAGLPAVDPTLRATNVED